MIKTQDEIQDNGDVVRTTTITTKQRFTAEQYKKMQDNLTAKVEEMQTTLNAVQSISLNEK